MVTAGLKTSSRRYRSLIEGSPIKIKIIAGTTVQKSSRGWESRIILSRSEFLAKEYILNLTIVVIRIRMDIAWS
jgi:hypothetical protein